MGHAVYSPRNREEPAGSVPPARERLQAFVDKLAPIFGGDSRKWLLKTVRELRGAMVAGQPVSGRFVAQDLAERLGKPELWVALESPLLAEIAAFSAESEGHPRAVASTVFDEDNGWTENKE